MIKQTVANEISSKLHKIGEGNYMPNDSGASPQYFEIVLASRYFYGKPLFKSFKFKDPIVMSSRFPNRVNWLLFEPYVYDKTLSRK